MSGFIVRQLSTGGLERYPEDSWEGLQVFAIDGALLRTPDTPELREHFGTGNTSTDRQTPFPMMRLVSLMNVRSHIMVDAQISPYRKGEIPQAQTLVHQLPNHSVTLFDKAFWSANLLLNLALNKNHRHWVIPARKRLVSKQIKQYNAHDRLLEMKVSPQARKQNPDLPETWQVRAVSYCINGVDKTVYTSLPYDTYPTHKVAQLYHERWEIELGYRDIKSSMQHNALTLRSKKMELVEQEVWGLLLAYNLIRREASQAAVSYGKAPNQISFKAAFQYIAVQLMVMAEALSPSKTGARLSELRGGVASLIIENRPRPSRPRSVKMSKTRYPVNRYASPLK